MTNDSPPSPINYHLLLLLSEAKTAMVFSPFSPLSPLRHLQRNPLHTRNRRPHRARPRSRPPLSLSPHRHLRPPATAGQGFRVSLLPLGLEAGAPSEQGLRGSHHRNARQGRRRRSRILLESSRPAQESENSDPVRGVPGGDQGVREIGNGGEGGGVVWTNEGVRL